MTKINSDKTYLGIEIGSTRIKAVLIDDKCNSVASGSFEWENIFEDGYWTYSLDMIHEGVRMCYKNLSDNVMEKYGMELKTVGAIGVSAMMHGYLAFDIKDRLLVPFRTWRNTTTAQAASELTKLFDFNIPQRWSIAHLYQAILNNEEHIEKVSYITTLAGYIHYLLTGRREVGIGDASGIFPIKNNDYNSDMADKFNTLIRSKGLSWDIRDILPKVCNAGDSGAYLTEEGAKFLDESGNLEAGIAVCPPEGDAGTGMVATNAVMPKTGNVSAGTSIFAMLVLEKDLDKVHEEIDIVTTPDGVNVAMVHCNNCCNELDTWVNIFGEFAALMGIEADKSTLYEKLYTNAMNGESSGIAAYNYLSGEHVTKINSGRPMYFRMPDVKMNLADFMKVQMYSAISTLTIGLVTLFNDEKAKADKFVAHGGLFKVKGVAQQILANALDTPVSVMQTAGEGGAWGMALLAAYMMNKSDKTLGEWLNSDVFSDISITTLSPEEKGVNEFKGFLELYQNGLAAERELEEVKQC